MGQYYDILIEQNGQYYHSDRTVCNVSGFAKLMEHSWFENKLLECVQFFIYKKPSRVYWVGDYANNLNHKINRLNPKDIKKIYSLCYGVEKDKRVKEINSFNSEDAISFNNRFLVNYTKKIYIDGTLYYTAAINEEGWCTNPLSLLTALGNGQGGGDYCGREEEKVGAWAGDWISIEDNAPLIFEDKTFDYIFPPA